MCRNFLFYLIPILLLGFASCERDDDEPPAREYNGISRLYVTTSDYDSGAASQIDNIWVVDSADTENASSYITNWRSPAKGGRNIHFSPLNGGMVFQSSVNAAGVNDTAIHVFTVSDQGNVSTSGKLANRRFDNVRGLAYTVVNSGINASSDFLLAVNKGISDDFGNLFVFLNPRSSGAFKQPTFRVSLNFIPWGIFINEKDVYMVKTGSEGGIVAYTNMTQNFVEKRDTVLSIEPSYTLAVDGSQNLRGVSYSPSKDILVLTDYSSTGGTIPVGRILIFENFSSHVSSKSIEPTRVITGETTNLRQPMDVAIDPRAGGQYIYVADSQRKGVYRFNIDDNGNVAPNAEISLRGATPEGLSWDARD